MSVKLHNLTPAIGSTKNKKRIGRGGKSGTYSGKGMKGQKSRSGSSGLERRGFKAQLQQLPKLRGFKSRRPVILATNLSVLEKEFNAGDTVNMETLISKGVFKNKDLKTKFKILGNGELTKKLVVEADAFSVKAKESIEKAGGEAKQNK